jgi:prolipoprotein diacylglyceryl transferase
MHSTVDLWVTEIPVYTAWVMLGIILGSAIAYAFLRARSHRASAPMVVLDVLLIALVAGWVGARLYHVAANWGYYAAYPEEIFQPGLGGLAMRGAFIFGCLALAIYSTVKKISFWYFADAAALALALGQALGWVGALEWGANYGVLNDSQIAVDLPDIYGLIQPRFPLQYIEIMFFAVLVVVLLSMTFQISFKGNLFAIYLVSNSIMQFMLGFMRGDATAHIGALRVDQVVDCVLLILGLGVVFWGVRTNERSRAV